MEVARDPWVRTMWTFAQILDHERLVRIERDFHDYDVVNHMRIAYHKPNELRNTLHSLKVRHRLVKSKVNAFQDALDIMREREALRHTAVRTH